MSVREAGGRGHEMDSMNEAKRVRGGARRQHFESNGDPSQWRRRPARMSDRRKARDKRACRDRQRWER